MPKYKRTKEKEKKYPEVPSGGVIESIKDMINTRGNEKSGEYYIKGKKAHMTDDFEYASDPELEKNRGYHGRG